LTFFENIHETQITRNYPQPIPGRAPRRRLFATGRSPAAIARAAVREVLG
jgi:hypothetical protein